MTKLIDITSRVFGLWTVVDYAGRVGDAQAAKRVATS